MEIIKLPENLGQEKENFSNNVIKGNFHNSRTKKELEEITTEVPFLGKIAAGIPIEAISDNSNYISMMEKYLGLKLVITMLSVSMSQ